MAILDNYMFRPVLAIFRLSEEKWLGILLYALRAHTWCRDLYWPSAGCLKRTGLGSYYMHCARTCGVEISTGHLQVVLKELA